MLRRIIPIAVLSLFAATACEELDQPRDVMGNFEVEYENNLRVYINDTLVAEVAEGEDATIEWDGETFQVSAICADEGTECPDETFWSDVAVDQPWGTDNALLNFVNLDEERGTPGQRMGGLLHEDGTFEMLAGLGIAANGACAAIGVGVVDGWFTEDAEAIEDGVIAYGWGAGCVFGSVAITGALRLETDFTAARVGDYDVTSVEPEPPIDEEGETIDPSRPRR